MHPDITGAIIRVKFLEEVKFVEMKHDLSIERRTEIRDRAGHHIKILDITGSLIVVRIGDILLTAQDLQNRVVILFCNLCALVFLLAKIYLCSHSIESKVSSFCEISHICYFQDLVWAHVVEVYSLFVVSAPGSNSFLILDFCNFELIDPAHFRKNLEVRLRDIGVRDQLDCSL